MQNLQEAINRTQYPIHAPVAICYSGGVDSCVSLAWARRAYKGEIHLLRFNYGQRHIIELEKGKQFHDALQAREVHQTTLKDIILPFPKGSRYALVDGATEIDENTVVLPGLHVLMLAHAMVYAVSEQVMHVIIGPCQTQDKADRQQFLYSMEDAGTHDIGDNTINLVSPTLNLNKSEVYALAEYLDVLKEVAAYSHSCLEGGT